jgi:8-oxo-dGTP pyrophosphatase MutT (NUDIX family)
MADRIIPQSAVIPYRRRDGAVEVLLIRSASGRRWVVPKGIIEPDMTPVASAANEAWEEAGIRGRVLPATAGTYRYDKWGGTCEVEVFLMEVTEVLDDWPESYREREWVTVEEAVSRVAESDLQALLRELPSRLGESS